MQIYMMRHGQSQSNADKTVTGQQESPLSYLGGHQAELAAQKIKGLNIGLIVCSPLQRAKQTAKIIAKQIDYPIKEIVVDLNLAERALGKLEGKSYATNQRMNGNYPETEEVEGIEPLEHLHARANYALLTILKNPKKQNVLIVSHMNVGRMLWVITKGMSPKDLYEQPRLENAKVYELTKIN